MRHIYLPLLCAMLLTSGAIAAVPSPSGPVVIELFTSQGCSSCPPADKLLAELNKRPDVIAISRPVTYWDRLGWKDTLARPENTQAQYDYAARLKGEGVYTPQAVVQGRFETIGSRAAALQNLVERARAPSALQVQRLNSESVQLRWLGPAPAALKLRLVHVKPSVDVAIGRGENSGSHIAYTNVLQDDVLLPLQFDAEHKMTIKVPPRSAQTRYAILANTGLATPIVAASWVD